MKIHETAAAATARMTAMNEDIQSMVEYLDSDKFRGIDPRDGQANEYIRTVEVIRFLKELQKKAQVDTLEEDKPISFVR